MSKNKQMLEFLGYLKKLEVPEAVGVARLLGLKLEDESGEPKDNVMIAEELYVALMSAPRGFRRELLDVMEAAVS